MKKKTNKRMILIIVCIIVVLLLIYIRLLSHPIKSRVGDFTVIFYSNRVGLRKYHGNEENIILPNTIGIMPVTQIGGNCFAGNSKIKSVTIPKNIKIIYDGAFMDCKNLETVKAENVQYIGWGAFVRDKKLEIADFGNSLEVIDVNSFGGCKALTYIPYSKKLNSIGQLAFCGSGIEEIGDLSGVNVEGGYIFADTPWMDKQDTDYVIINNVLQQYKGDKSVSIIPNGVEVLSEAYGEGTEKALTIYLPESVKRISAIGLFDNPNYVIYIPASVEYIKDNDGVIVNGCKIITVSGSYAEQYAKEHGMNYEIVDGWEVPKEDSAE